MTREIVELLEISVEDALLVQEEVENELDLSECTTEEFEECVKRQWEVVQKCAECARSYGPHYEGPCEH